MFCGGGDVHFGFLMDTKKLILMENRVRNILTTSQFNLPSDF